MAARAAHPIRGSGGICYQVHPSWVSTLVWKSPMLALVDGAAASAARQIAVRVRSLMCHGRLRLEPGSSEALKPTALLLLSLRGTLFSQRFLRFLFRLTLAVQTFAHGLLPRDGAHLSRSATRSTAPCALPCRHANIHRPKGQQCCAKTSILEAARNLSACLSRPRRTPALSPGQSLTS